MNPDSKPIDDLDRGGLGLAFAAFVVWGFFPLYFNLYPDAGAWETFAQRALWALPAVAAGLLIAGKFKAALRQVARPKALGALAVTTTLIAVNWMTFIWAIQNGEILQSSLAYFMNPIANVLLGVALLGERLGRVKWIAVGLAAVGVVNQALVVGEPPWLAFVMLSTFAAYGFLRKVAKVDAGAGLLVETAMMAPFMIATVIWLEAAGRGHFFAGPAPAAWLILGGPLTAAPLFLFAAAARKLPLSVLGLLQYIAPSLHFVFALVLGEAFTPAHAITFGFIWTGLALFTFDTFRGGRGRRRAAVVPAATDCGPTRA